MKKISLLLLFISVFCFSQTAKLKTVAELNDSIVKLNKRPVMSQEQFIRLYKYDRLVKYYQICKRKPSQWKYYKGWSIRVFEL